MVANFGQALTNVVEGQTRQEDAGIFDLNAIVKKSHPNGSPLLRIVGVNQRVNDHLAQNSKRNAPAVFASNCGKVGPAHGVFFEKQQDAFDCLRQWVVQFDVIENIRFVSPDKASTLHPSIGKMSLPFFADEQDRPLGRYPSPLLVGQQSQGQ